MSSINSKFDEEAWIQRQFDPPNCKCQGKRKTLYRADIRKVQFDNDDEEPEKNEEVQVAENFGSNWSAHGPIHIVRSKHWLRRLVWSLFWTAMVIIGFVMCVRTLTAYFKYPINVSIQVKDVKQLEFPAVTICSLPSLTPTSNKFFKSSRFWKSFLEVAQEHETCDSKAKYRSQHQILVEEEQMLEEKENCLNEDSEAMTSTRIAECFDLMPKIPDTEFYKHDLLDEHLESRQTIITQHSFLNDSFVYISIHEDGYEAEYIRKHCNLVFQIILYKERLRHGEEAETDFHLNDFSNCPSTIVAEYKDSFYTLYDAICGIVIYIDLFGAFNSFGFPCDPIKKKTINGKNYICSSCCLTFLSPCIIHEELELMKYINFEMSTSPKALANAVLYSATADGYGLIDTFFTPHQDINKFSHKKSEVITTCSFDEQPCSFWNFEEWENYRFGKCYTFNPGIKKAKKKFQSTNIRYTRSSGADNGLRLTMNIYSNDSLDLITPEYGAKVILHKSKTIPFPEDEGFIIAPGVSNSVRVKLTKIIRTAQPYGKCGAKKLESDYKYSQNLCYKLCLEKAIRKECKCFPGISPAYDVIHQVNEFRRCSSSNSLDRTCVDHMLFKFYHKLIDCDCPISCKDWQYSPNFMATLTDKNYLRIVQNVKGIKIAEDTCDDELEDSTVRLHIYFDELSYEVITEKPSFTLITLVANLGGNFGLFVGMSIISLVEFGEFLVDCVSMVVKRFWPNKNQEEKTKRKSVFLSVNHLKDPKDMLDQLSNINQRKQKKSEAFETIFLKE